MKFVCCCQGNLIFFLDTLSWLNDVAMTSEIVFNGLFFMLLCFVRICSTAVVDVNHTSSHPNGLIVVPENLRTSTLTVSFNETVQNDNVVVICSIVESVNGITKVVFENTTALIGQTGAVVNFSIISPGQPVTIQCSAQSEGNSTQFIFSTSKGKPGYLQVTKAPIVTICTDPVLVATDHICQTIGVELSETVSGQFPAVVNCSVIGANNDGPQFKFEPTIINVGRKTAQVPYITISTGVQSKSVHVICVAQTYNVTRLPTQVICGKGPVTSTTTAPLTPAASNMSNITATSATDTIPTPPPLPEIFVPQFITSEEGVEYFQYMSGNSAGSPVTFTLNPLTLQFYPNVTSIHEAYSIILTLNTPQIISLDVACSLTSLPAGKINTSYINCPSEANDAVSLASSGVQLKLEETEIQFKRSEVSKSLRISVIGSPVTRVRDLVQLSCCPKVTSVLKPSPVGAFLWADLPRQQPTDTNSGDSSASTSPLDIDLTCPCNLKEQQCDTGCCCDQDCSSSERSSFSCIKGFFGGDTAERPMEFSCEGTWPDSTNVQPFLCVTISNSPFIGYWFNFTSPPTAKDLPEYNSLLTAAKKTRFSYQTSAQPSSPSDGTYKAGTTIKTAANSNDNQYLGASLGILSLPKKIFSGLCSQYVPVRFLENSESSCTKELTESLCTASSSLSASSFLMSKQMTSPPCPIPAAVLRKGALGQTQSEPPELAEVEVQYFCTADSSAFVSVKSGPGSGPESDRSIWRCGFDDGKVAPPLPAFNSTSKICSNVVLNVTYQFEAYGQEISKVKASITLGNVQIPSTSQSSSESSIATADASVNTITQYFTSKFIHSSVFNISGSAPAMTVARSGNPGYVKGLPLLAMKKSTNNSASQLLVRVPSADGLCSSSRLSSPILYGEALTSGCSMKLGFSDMRNCTRVRELVRTYHEALLEATHVGRTGNARVTIDEDWLPIIRDKIKESPSTPNHANTSGECADIPQVQLIQVLVSQAGFYRGVPQMEVVGLRISYQYTTWRYRCVSGYGLSCLATPTAGSNVTSNNKNVNEIVSPVNSTITPTATVSITASSSAALNGSSVRQDNTTSDRSSSYSPRQMLFMTETSVVFITVPATEPVRVKRSLDHTGICYQEVCKEELFYPLSPAYQGESKEKVMAYSLFLIFLTLVIFVCTKPWG